MAFLAVSFNVLVIYDVVVLGKMVYVDEGGFVETTTAFCALASFFVLLFSAICVSGFKKLVTTFFAIGCLLFFLREVDVEDYHVPFLLHYLGVGEPRNVMISFGFLGILVWYLVKYRRDFSLVRKELKTPAFFSALFGLFCFGLGALVEMFEWLVVEEIAEMTGGFAVLLAALLLSFDNEHARSGSIWE